MRLVGPEPDEEGLCKYRYYHITDIDCNASSSTAENTCTPIFGGDPIASTIAVIEANGDPAEPDVVADSSGDGNPLACDCPAASSSSSSSSGSSTASSSESPSGSSTASSSAPTTSSSAAECYDTLPTGTCGSEPSTVSIDLSNIVKPWTKDPSCDCTGGSTSFVFDKVGSCPNVTWNLNGDQEAFFCVGDEELFVEVSFGGRWEITIISCDGEEIKYYKDGSSPIGRYLPGCPNSGYVDVS